MLCGRVGGHVELDDLDLAVGEDVGLAGGREPECGRDRVGGLELGRDHEVDLEVALAPGVEVGGARGADDRLRARQPLDQHRADEVGLLARAAADEQVGLLDAGLADHLLGRAVALDRADVVAARERGEPVGGDVDHRDLVLLVERVDQRAADVRRAEHDDLHAAESSRHDARMLGVDIRGALNLVGSLFKYLSPAFLLPAAIALGYGEAVWPFLVAGAMTFAFGAGVEALTDGKEHIGPREGYLVVSLIWLLIAVFGALPYLLAEPQLVEPARRAVRVDVGLLDDRRDRRSPSVGDLSRSMAMWRQFTAWIGGVGIIVLFLAVLPRLRIGGRQALFKAESAGPELGLAATIRESAQRFVVLYVGDHRRRGGDPHRLRLHRRRRAHDVLQRRRASRSRRSPPRASRPSRARSSRSRPPRSG